MIVSGVVLDGMAIPLPFIHSEPDTPSDGATPAVFALHGRRADERELLSITRGLPGALHVVCFRAPLVQPKTADPLSESDARDIVPWDHGGVAWYDPELSPADATKPQPRGDQLQQSLELLSESVDAVVDAVDLDPEHLGLLGFDQGAVVSLALLLENPARYAWVVALNGYLPATHRTLAPDGIRDTPVFISAGEDDPMVPAARSTAAAERLRDLGADVTLRVYQSSHGVGPEELHDLVEFVDAQLE